MAGNNQGTVQDSVNAIIESCGGDVWDSHPDISREDWKQEVQNDSTNLGYWEFVYNTLESQ